ncbi:hypothetical protein SLEP1_g19446 [Rubroshorea leprosula]|uniref:Uncharacterized protein n=1 Tax=Rubroshorea leprosula TaxID=152421 RepID=A0AAV5JA16_9ROSI|nr:hypothetical protein SLEP1_g19446 [Rubroshorea leprosula]
MFVAGSDRKLDIRYTTHQSHVLKIGPYQLSLRYPSPTMSLLSLPPSISFQVTHRSQQGLVMMIKVNQNNKGEKGKQGEQEESRDREKGKQEE